MSLLLQLQTVATVVSSVASSMTVTGAACDAGTSGVVGQSGAATLALASLVPTSALSAVTAASSGSALSLTGTPCAGVVSSMACTSSVANASTSGASCLVVASIECATSIATVSTSGVSTTLAASALVCSCSVSEVTTAGAHTSTILSSQDVDCAASFTELAGQVCSGIQWRGPRAGARGVLVGDLEVAVAAATAQTSWTEAATDLDAIDTAPTMAIVVGASDATVENANMNRKQHDTAIPLTATLTIGGAYIDLTGCTVKLVMSLKGSTAPTVDALVDVVDASAGKVSYQWGDTDLALAGEYQGEFLVTYPDLRIIRCPSVGYMPILVEAAL